MMVLGLMEIHRIDVCDERGSKKVVDKQQARFGNEIGVRLLMLIGGHFCE